MKRLRVVLARCRRGVRVVLAGGLRLVPPALIGALTLFSFAPFHFWPFACVSLALAFGMIEVAPTPARAARVAWAYGLGYFAANIHWIYIALYDYGGMPAPLAVAAVLLLAAFLALYPALVAYAGRRIAGESRAVLLIVTLPACWLLSEWLRSWVFTGFPWASIGYSQVPGGPLAGWFPIIGVYGVGGLVAAFSGVLTWLMGRRIDRRAAGVVLVAVAVGLSGYPLARIDWTHPVGKPLHVALAQGAIPQNQKWSTEDLIYNLRVYYRLIDEAQGDLIVLPETAFPIFLHDVPDDYMDAILDQAKRKHAAMIVGVPREDGDDSHYFNAAVLLTDPAQPANYKAHLVPFGEYVPVRPVLGWVYRQVLHMPLDDFTAGASRQTPLKVADQRIAANICYEDVFGEELIPNARQATILLNLSNLAWFDGSLALAQHGQIAQARSLETGRPSLLATNSGTTAIVDAKGRYRAKLPERVQADLTGVVQGYDGLTPYLRWGNAAALTMAAVALAVTWRARRRSARNRYPV
ncbi:MAG: apolipoprotein N-acyltransferase [Burkholderiales bacterium]|nr:apolipoprotein N-acyltransferase [Burkholderiales bacterium]